MTDGASGFRRLLATVNSSSSLPSVYARCHEILRASMSANNMYVCIIEPEGLRFPYFIDEIAPENPLDLYPKEGLTGFVIDTGRRLWLGRDGYPEGIRPVGPLPSDFIAVPLAARNGAILGVLAVQTYDRGLAYSDDDADLAESAAHALSLAIQLTRLDRELATYQIGALVEETVDSAELYPRIHRILMEIIPAARKNLIIARVDEAAGVFRSEYLIDEHWPFPSDSWPLDEGMSGYIFSYHRRSFIFEDGRTVLPPEARLPGGLLPKFWLGAPLVGQGRIIGIVILQSYEPDETITKEDEFALNAICPHIATAIGRTELFSRFGKR